MLMSCIVILKKIFDELGWKANRDLDDMCKTSYLFQSKNPDGYGDNGVVKMVFEN